MSIEVSTDPSRLDVAMIHAFLASESYWVPGISRANVENSIKHSLCFGVYVDGRQAAFARVVTDFVRFAHVLDVFVLKEFRGRGFGKLLVRTMLAHPDLSTIIRFTLGTADAQGLYAQFGFTAPANPERQMELLRPNGAPPPPQTAADR
ncbi:MAG: GNAT family N-acetyltransferase [Steroidobacteraceae bacterium]